MYTMAASRAVSRVYTIELSVGRSSSYVQGMFGGQQIKEEERRRFLEVLEDENRDPKEESKVMKDFETEYKKLKVEGQRVTMKDGTTSAYYTGEGRPSRFDFGRKEDYKRSGSGVWRSKSGNRSWRSQSRPGQRSQTGQRPQSGQYRPQSGQNRPQSRSGSRRPNDKAIVTNVDLMEALKKMDERLQNVERKTLNVAYVEEEEVTLHEVFFSQRLKEDAMVLMDLGAPSSLAGQEAIERYVTSIGQKMEDIEVVKCQRRYRFGPGRVYDSIKLYNMPVVVETEEGRTLFLAMKVTEVEAPIPILCGKDTMKTWDMVIRVKEEILRSQIFIMRLTRSRLKRPQVVI